VKRRVAVLLGAADECDECAEWAELMATVLRLAGLGSDYDRGAADAWHRASIMLRERAEAER
jgi:hypothetical protein